MDKFLTLDTVCTLNEEQFNSVILAMQAMDRALHFIALAAMVIAMTSIINTVDRSN